MAEDMRIQEEASRLQGYAATAFVVALPLLLIAGQPCLLLPLGFNYETKLFRLFIPLLLGVASGGGAFLLAKREKRWRSAFAIPAIMGLVALFLAFMPVGMSGNGMSFPLPTKLLILVPTLFVLATAQTRLPAYLLACCGVFCMFVLIHLAMHWENADQVLPYFACVLVPAAVALLFHERRLTVNHISLTAGTLWCLTIATSIIDVLRNRYPTGISGNPNWVACILLGTAPWAGYGIWSLLLPRFPKRPYVNALVAVLVVLPISLYVLYHCHTRTAYLALGGYTLFLALSLIRRWWQRSLIVLLLGAVIIVAFVIQFSAIHRAYNQDLRLPLWSSCLRLTADAPLTGVGPRNVQRQLPDLLAESRLHERLVASEWVAHPHNEVINLMTNFGIPAAFAWTLSLIVIFRNPRTLSWPLRITQFSGIQMLLLGMTDKGLFLPPSDLWWLVILGLCWSPFVAEPATTAHPLMKRLRPVTIAAGSLVTCVLLLFAYRNTMHNWLLRRANQMLAANHMQQGRLYYLKALHYQPLNVDTAYRVAALSLQKLKPFNPQMVLEDLNRVYLLNPNFSHINRFLGRYYGLTGEHDKALGFFLRDMALFPEDVRAHQWHLLALFESGNPTDLLQAEEDLDAAYAKRAIRSADFYGPEDLPLQWLRHAEKGDWQAARHAANLLLRRMGSHGDTEPLAPWHRQPGWPSQFGEESYIQEDIPYWQSVLQREEIWEDTLGTSKDPAKIISLLTAHMTIDQKIPTTLPHLAWKTGTCNLETAYSILAWLSTNPVFIYSATSPEDSSALTRSGEHLLLVNLHRKSVRFLAPEDIQTLPADMANQLQLISNPHSCAARHQILNAVTQEMYGSYRKHIRFGRQPSIQIASDRKHYENFGIILPTSIPLWSPLLETWKQALTE